ncbi:hypothetical protein MUP77_19745 [Candidatus Bathyarchaeota archaeon]|nr:hypothetical protein [Candidatus Bathyarchaeota archaeon]
MTKKTTVEHLEPHPRFIGVLVDWKTENSRDYAIKFIAHTGFDKLLCDHVYFGFCQDCSQVECDRRRR